jgi:hypothetical protein
VKPGFGLIVVIAIAAAVGGGYYVYERTQRAAEIEALLAAVETELGRKDLDRSELTRLARRVTAHPASTVAPPLIRARARLQLRLDQLQDAWETQSLLALDPERAEPADLLLGARILERLHATRGAAGNAAQAMGLAQRHYDRTGEPGSLLLAWQCATRAQQQPDAERIAARLASEHPRSWEARVVAALGAFDPAANDARSVLETLAREAPTVPEELDLALALVELQRGNLAGGASLLDGVLERFPVSVEARVLRAGVRHERGDLAGRDADLRRALELAAPDDERRARWQAMLQRN